jgi:4-hydroxy-tetrahydrodipicolinate synthase
MQILGILLNDRRSIMKKQLRGIYAIPPTIFYDNLEVDYKGTRRCIRFLLDAKVHGIVVPVFSSEHFLLTDDERKKVLEAAIKEVNGAVPIVAGVSADKYKSSVEFAKHASACGADAVLAVNPPRLSMEEVRDYFKQIDKAVNIPVFIQNIAPNTPNRGKSMSAEFMISVISQMDNVCYIKEECIPSNTVIQQALEMAKNLPEGKLSGIMGGKGSRLLIEEYERGACGSMPPTQMADVLVDIWELLEKGNKKAAFDLHTRVMPALIFCGTYGMPSYKEMLKRRGIIDSTVSRPAGYTKLDKEALRDLGMVMEYVKPLFRVNY